MVSWSALPRLDPSIANNQGLRCLSASPIIRNGSKLLYRFNLFLQILQYYWKKTTKIKDDYTPKMNLADEMEMRLTDPK